jgi:hypothetical protein
MSDQKYEFVQYSTDDLLDDMLLAKVADTRLEMIKLLRLEISELRLRLNAATNPDLEYREVMIHSANEIAEQRKSMAKAFRDKTGVDLSKSPSWNYPRFGEKAAS